MDARIAEHGPGDFVISKATPAVTTWPTASDITEGQALTNSIFSGGSASVGGNFDWELPATVPPVGTNSETGFQARRRRSEQLRDMLARVGHCEWGK